MYYDSKTESIYDFTYTDVVGFLEAVLYLSWQVKPEKLTMIVKPHEDETALVGFRFVANFHDYSIYTAGDSRTTEELLKAYIPDHLKFVTFTHHRGRPIVHFTCNKGHHNEIYWERAMSSFHCRHCQGRMSDQNWKEKLAETGWTVIGGGYSNGKYSEVTCTCKNDHTRSGEIRYFLVQPECRVCDGLPIAANKDSFRDKLAEAGWELLDETQEFVNQKSKFTCKCKSGHSITASYRWLVDRGCVECIIPTRRSEHGNYKR